MSHRPTHATVTLQPPYDFARSIGFWGISTGELCEHWSDGALHRVVDVASQPRILTLRSLGTIEQPGVAVELDQQPADAAMLPMLEPHVRHLLGDDLDLRAFYAALGTDPVFAPVIERLRGLKPNRSPLWETLCFVIIGQQISLPFAFKLKQRLVTRYGEPFAVAGQPLYRFPSPAVLAAAEPEELMAMQFSRNKASFIIGLAQQILDGTLELDRLPALATPDAVAYLTQFRGIGAWTAEFTLMRALGRVDAIPANDAGVRNGISMLYGQKLPEAALRVFAERWSAWGGIVALYLLGWLREETRKRTA